MSDADLDRKARDLQKAFEACPGYRKYREKTKESDKLEAAGKNYKKWPDEMEFAFFKGLFCQPYELAVLMFCSTDYLSTCWPKATQLSIRKGQKRKE